MQVSNDKKLHELAHKRVEFRRHLTVYLVINGVLWSIWAIVGSSYPWPIWPTLGWGVGLLFHYVFDYRTARFFSEQDEFEKLKKQEQQHSNQLN